MNKEARQQGGGVPDGFVVGLLALLLGLAALIWTATGLAGLLAHGGWPPGVTFTRTPQALRSLMTAPTDLAAAWPTTPPASLSGYGLFWGLVIGEAMVLTVLAVFALGTFARWRTVRATQRKTPAAGRRPVAEAPTPTEIPASTGTPDVTTPAPHDPIPRQAAPPPHTAPPPGTGAGASAGAGPDTGPDTSSDVDWGTGAGAGADALTGPPGTGTATTTGTGTGTGIPTPTPAPRLVYAPAAARRATAAQAVRDAEGAALVVTSDPNLWADTKDARAKLGPVLVYDPGHLCDTPARLHWNPADGCEDPDTARDRAVALLAPVRPQSRLDAAVADTAETLLRGWLHAAATDGRPFKQVHRWAQGTDAHEPVRILRTHPKAATGHAGLLESALTAHPERRRAAQELTARALSGLSSIHIRQACTPNRTDSLTLASFVAEQGTLYVVGEPIEDPRTHPGAMPLLTALAASVVEHGRRMAARSSDGRLDPPLTLVLDDVAAVAPIPRLPELLARGEDTGLPALALMRSREQARSRWPEHDPLSR
ncbi:type VI secretion protein [Streptomyces roseicoloratus]|uniref:type VI secretion protein n=1 Tax=Streptomyces roseicoloratus TaxID=2508722 RepID=UPI00100989F7|nr:type VI secretion protein [Streptomyces roseicoloratus]